MDPFPFIVGCGRSGTTLLRAMLDSHPDLAVAHETNFIPKLGWERSQFDGDAGFDVELFIRKSAAMLDPTGWDVPAETTAEGLRAVRPAGFADAVRVLYRLYADHHGKPRYADKSPRHVLHIALIASLLPESRFIHIVRDGRNVALAYRDQEFGPQTIGEGAMHWRWQVGAGRRAGRSLGPERYTEIRYEDLIDDPEAVLSRVARFIDIPYDPVMLEYFRRADQVIASTGHQSHHESLRRPPTKGLRRWQDAMTEHEQAVFDILAGSLLADLGYAGAAPRHTLRARIEAARRFTLWYVERTTERPRRVIEKRLIRPLTGRR